MNNGILETWVIWTVEAGICQPSDPNGGEWPEHIGEMAPACARATRTLLNHTPIGECRRFFPWEKIACPCSESQIEPRFHILHGCNSFTHLPESITSTRVLCPFSRMIPLHLLLLKYYRIVSTNSLFWFFSEAYWGQFWVPSFWPLSDCPSSFAISNYTFCFVSLRTM